MIQSYGEPGASNRLAMDSDSCGALRYIFESMIMIFLQKTFENGTDAWNVKMTQQVFL